MTIFPSKATYVSENHFARDDEACNGCAAPASQHRDPHHPFLPSGHVMVRRVTGDHPVV